MGVHSNISTNLFPKQGSFLDRRVLVSFNYDTNNTVLGTIVRDDIEDPFVTIIKLDDGRFVLSTECQFTEL
ncbi:hypothetical protein D1872_248190 [compost metagenome]